MFKITEILFRSILTKFLFKYKAGNLNLGRETCIGTTLLYRFFVNGFASNIAVIETCGMWTLYTFKYFIFV